MIAIENAWNGCLVEFEDQLLRNIVQRYKKYFFAEKQALFHLSNGKARIHAYQDAPFLKNVQSSDVSGTIRKLPVVVFSHGLGGNRTVNSCFCADLASHGFFVASVEHRDRSAAATYFIDENHKEIPVLPLIPDFTKTDEFKLRNEQVTQRATEVSMALKIIDMLNQDNCQEELVNMIDSKFDFKSLQGSLDMDKVAVVGHSFGGATSLKTLAHDKRFKCAVVFDAWMFPLDDDVYNNVEQPVLFINSETFHTKVEAKKIIKIMGHDKEKKMLTIMGTCHYCQCDVPSVVPFWILKVLKMSGNLPHNVSTELHRRLLMLFLNTNLGLSDEPMTDFSDNKHIIEGTTVDLSEEEHKN